MRKEGRTDFERPVCHAMVFGFYARVKIASFSEPMMSLDHEILVDSFGPYVGALVA